MIVIMNAVYFLVAGLDYNLRDKTIETLFMCHWVTCTDGKLTWEPQSGEPDYGRHDSKYFGGLE